MGIIFKTFLILLFTSAIIGGMLTGWNSDKIIDSNIKKFKNYVNKDNIKEIEKLKLEIEKLKSEK